MPLEARSALVIHAPIIWGSRPAHVADAAPPRRFLPVSLRYMTSTHIGTWAMDKLIRFALLTRDGQPIVWDFGSAARHHRLYNPWLANEDGTSRSRPGISTLRGAFHPDAGIAEEVACKIKLELDRRGLGDAPLGVDVVEPPVLFALQRAGITVVDGQQVFLEARRIKTSDEIALLTQACSMVDAAYEGLYEFLRPGVKENAGSRFQLRAENHRQKAAAADRGG